MVRDLKEQTWKLSPGYLFSYNTHVDFRWNIKVGTVPKPFQEKCRDGGLIAQEELTGPGIVPWEQYIKLVRHNSDLARYYGGHYAISPFLRNPRFLYCYIIPYALRAHEMYMYVPMPNQDSFNLGRFATRYASLLWDHSVHGWALAEKEVKVEASRMPWWQHFAAVRPSPTGGTQFILHLINPPDS